MIDIKTAPYAALLLRVSLGMMFIFHSLYLKVMVFTIPGTVQFFESLGLPGFSADLVAITATITVLKIDPAVVLKVGMNGNIEHPSNAHQLPEKSARIGIGFRRTLDKRRLLTIAGDDAQAAHFFRQ